MVINIPPSGSSETNGTAKEIVEEDSNRIQENRTIEPWNGGEHTFTQTRTVIEKRGVSDREQQLFLHDRSN